MSNAVPFKIVGYISQGASCVPIRQYPTAIPRGYLDPEVSVTESFAEDFEDLAEAEEISQ